MALYTLPKQYHPDFAEPTRKPTGGVEIDKTDPYGKNVFAAWNFATPENWLVDAATGKVATRVGTSVFLEGSDGNLNIESDGNGVNHRINLGSITSDNPISLTDASTDGKYTIFTRCRVNSGALSTGFGRLIDKSNAGNGGGGWMISHDTASDEIRFWTQNAVRLQVSMTRDTWLDVAVVVGGITPIMYVNSGQDTGAVPAPATTTTNAAIANWNHNTDRQWGGQIAYIHMHYGAYSESEVKDYWKNPNRIFKPVDAPVYFTADGGGGTITITEAVSTLNITTQDPTIAFTGSIAIEESTATLNLTSVDPVIDFTGLVSITESVSTLNTTSVDPTITLTAANTISITEAVATLNIATQSPNITLSGTLTVIESTSTVNMLTRNPNVQIGEIAYQTFFDGSFKDSDFNGYFKSNQFTGTITTQSFSGTVKASIFTGVIQ